MVKNVNQIGINGNRFIDSSGRHVILRGVNMVSKDKSKNYIGEWTEKDFQNLNEWGFNVVRFGVIWDGIEPNPGEFDDAYIEEFRRLIKLAADYGLYIILDMHQDLFSSLYASGAPAWATLIDNESFEAGTVWSDAYLFNSAVQKAFDNFWNNSPGPDGVGIQDHYIKAWGYLTGKLLSEPNVIGYDMMNEPFIGSGTLQINEKMFTTYAEIYNKLYEPIDVEELFTAWSDPQQKQVFLGLLEDIEAFKQVVQAPLSVTEPFEKEILSSFYARIAAEIRKYDEKGILFLETNYFSNLGTPSKIEPVIGDDGMRDEFQAYAPHGYDLVTDTDLAHTANDQRLELIFKEHQQTSERLEMPMLIGEWGAFYDTDQTSHVSLQIKQIMEGLLCSDTYWSYTREMSENLSFLGINRGYPMAVAGRLLQYRYEHSLNSFHMKWDETNDSDSPSIVYLPDVGDIKAENITLDAGSTSYEIEKIVGTDAGLLKLPRATAGIRSLVIIGKSF